MGNATGKAKSGTPEAARAELAAVLGSHKGSVNAINKDKVGSIIKNYLEAGGSRDDVAVAIAEKVFEINVESLIEKKETSAVPAAKKALMQFDYMEKFMFEVLTAYGVPEDQARVCADVLIEADKRGIDSHGIGRLKPIYCDRIKAGILKPETNFEIVKESDTTAVVDGHGGMGLYIGPKCMELAIQKAKEHGIAMVVARNSTHYGIAGYYALQACREGCIGMTGTNARPSIAPTFGVEPMLGTNPLVFGMPSDDPFPFVIDCATSVNQRGKIEKYAREGMPTPAGCVVDRNGRTRTDTDQILKDLVTGQAALAPLGGVGDEMAGYKGYSYATVVEILCAALQDGEFGKALTGKDEKGKDKPMMLGHYFIAINIESFIGLDKFKKKTGDILRGLRASAKFPGHDRIYTAGEPEYVAFNERTAQGGFLIPEALMKDMVNLREELKLHDKYAKFPFEEEKEKEKADEENKA